MFDWDTAAPWTTDVKFIDFALRDLRRRQLFTHPDKLGASAVADYWPDEDLQESAKYMNREMHFLRSQREKLIKLEPARASPAGGTQRQPKAPPADYARPDPKPAPPRPGA
eukprot:1003202-Amphidinium_carterae.1